MAPEKMLVGRLQYLPFWARPIFLGGVYDFICEIEYTPEKTKSTNAMHHPTTDDRVK